MTFFAQFRQSLLSRKVMAGAGTRLAVACTVQAAFLLIALVSSSPAVAQEKKKDSTGTNPVNFTYDYRLYTELQQFTDDGGSLIRNTMEYRAPLGKDIANVKGDEDGFFSDLGQHMSLRFRGYYNSLSLHDPTSSSGASTSISGIGDFDARLLGLAYASDSFILAPGLEAFFDTASNSNLGSGGTTLAPVVFAAWLGALGKGTLFAPGYQYVFDVDGESVSRSQIDLYFVWILAKGKNWFLLDPQIILDHENDKEFMTVDAEWGFMIAPKQGVSGYVRPGMGVGAERPFAYNLEFAIKFIWR
jgi:hypothetical protein